LPAETQSALLHRAGGNPLYAEEFVRMVADDLARQSGELPLPESVQGIIAARLDGLPEDEKSLLQDAAVLGKVFWLGAVSGISGLESSRAEQALHALERKEFIRRERSASVAGETEYAFRHVLVRDVAYGQIPRARRAEKHRAAAKWIEALGRPEDHAEMLAHHYSNALELARATGVEAHDLAERARLSLREAGERAQALGSFLAASNFYAAALELWPRDDPERAVVLLRRAYIVEPSDFEARSEALEALRAVGDEERTAEAEVLLADSYWQVGQRDPVFEHLRAAEELVADAPSSYSKAYVTASVSRFWMLAGRHEDSIRIGREALAMAEELGLEELRANALNNIGASRLSLGDEGGFADSEQSIAIAVANNSMEAIRGYGNLASQLDDSGELERAFAIVEEGRRLAQRFGVRDWLRWLDSETAWKPYYAGDWDQATRQLDAFIRDFEETRFWMESPCRWLRGRIRLARGDVAGAADDAERGLELARVAKDPQLLWAGLAFAARTVHATDPKRAESFVVEVLREGDAAGWPMMGESDWSADLAVALRLLGRDVPFAGGAGQTATRRPWRAAAVAFVSGDFREAAETYARIGAKPEEAYARLRAAERFVREGKRREADAELERSLAFWRSVGATAYVREGEALMAASA
jgi:tetratricopeptide (TPR) repeat protein